VKKILGIVETFEPSAFITVEDVRSHIAGFIGDKGGPPFFGRMFAKRK